MNIYYLASNLVTYPIKQLHSMASFKGINICDLIVFRLDRRIVIAIVKSKDYSLRAIECPMVAQVIFEQEDMPKLLPILYFYDGYSKRVSDINGLKALHHIFITDKIVSKILLETIDLSKGKIEQRNMLLTLELLKCEKKIPNHQFDENYDKDHQNQSKVGKLLIVEEYLSPQIKKEYYDNITLGLSERESLVNLRRKYPKIFSKILQSFKDKDIYTRI